jgi:rod shape-determining protein MreD
LKQERQVIFMLFTLFLSMILMIIPLPNILQGLRPECLTLTMIYWVFVLPRHMGVVFAWFLGLIMDGLSGGLIGQHALAMSVVAYLAHSLRNRLGVTPFWQQCLVILVLVGLGQLLLLMVQWFVGHPQKTPLYWASTVISVFIWPWLYRVLGLYKNKVLR